MNSMNVKLKAGAFPKLLSDLSHSNQFLKLFAVGSLLLSVLLTSLVFVAFARKPIVITLTDTAEIMKQTELPKPEDEVRRAVLAYIERRYNWTSQTVDQQLERARAFIAAGAMRNLLDGTANVRRFSKEKNVTQRVYASNVAVDIKLGVVSVTGDRISEIQGVRAAGSMNLELQFLSGSRTMENPWGIYVIKETER